MTDSAVNLSDIIAHSSRARSIMSGKVNDIRSVNSMLRMLALNALIEARRAGDMGAGFGVVADEVKAISGRVEVLSKDLAVELLGEINALEKLTQDMAQSSQGNRLTDLAHNAIELIDRNLYERTCDVRWWATDSAFVDAAQSHDKTACRHATKRLGVILDAYTVYLDLWLCDLDGHVIANGRPQAYDVAGRSVANTPWFQQSRNLASGNDFAVADVAANPWLGGAQVATYATGVRENGDADGRLLGVLGIHFDWAPQALAITQGARLSPEDRKRSRVMLTDARGRIIADSHGKATLTESLNLKTEGRDHGHYTDADGTVTAFHRTPGYETYQGLGWYGVIVQKPA